ncbi:MAG: iron ABC transporter permease [Betaproteobacteria bacterium]|nr:iron ABC transporter permease [Betaproteobacteria bacterium]MBI2224039.1 iron ABC transporter permease [Betaproteobacteria bacterium]MBI2290910.1 iron ABC transporter permease [Betaproteobacteria bacterium]MBI3053903.1 iron ABC transporter permease [Betaproteobacteria bacterium]
MKLPRASVAMLGFGLIWVFLIAFVLYPLTRIFYDAVTNEAGQFTLVNFRDFFTDSFYLRSFWRSMVLGVAAVFTTSVVGIAVALLIIRYEFPYRKLFSYLTMLPMILPPLVGVLGFVFILGRAGTVNILLMDWFDMEHPINFMYGMHGILLVETVHLFPLMTLSILDSLSKVDPSLEEAAQGVGATGWHRFWTITLPLTTPGFMSGALLVFIWTFADFITPLVLGVQDLLAPQAYLNIMQFVDRRIFRMGIVISALLVVLAIIFVIAAREYVAIKDYSSLAYSKVERRRLGPVQRWLAVGFLTLLMIVCVIPQVGVVFAAVGRGWALTPFPVNYTLEFFRTVSIETPKFIINSFLYAGLALILCLIVGVPMAWIMARTRAPGRNTMDALTTLILAIPGTAIGIAYIRAFNFPLPVIDVPLTGMWLILPLVLAVRRLPYTVRGSFSSLLLVHPSLEEAAANVGASKLRTFRDITVPLVWKGILVGALFSFIMSIQEASATIFLTLGGWEMIPFGIFTFYIAGSHSQAAALGVILIVVCALSLYVVNRIAGTRVGGLFG